ncbi:MAG TPA: DsrE family protein [Xanthomonadales bacterium]|nr:DsrE family protein [Xanthomonadales bacterium]
MARVLVVFREGLAQESRVRDGIDLALAALAFDHEVTVLFTGAGAALPGEGGELAANLRALAYHGATVLAADADAHDPLAHADHVFAC